ncbi:DNA polymerase III subunit delta' [Desulfonatronovibrio hydrogenovorans]|uniref:DNA polymerase III subunit delta' n=1 Tax=Desulfonatronovibrio hydrogenovorans TaxID=53245 RepID=UPI001377F6E1|nr:DNA polymerase III subunit delta' [Desulfonatronovibrio hydrogenovorans]
MQPSQVIEQQPRIVSLLGRLKSSPPGCLLLEGGSSLERKNLALYWAMSLNCSLVNGPCLECKTCIQTGQEVFRDLIYLDPEEKLGIDQIRELRPIFSQKPHIKWRIIIIAEAQLLNAESANALLKSLEEPCPGNSFVLLTPQRQSLFPTLVSRSFTLSLSCQPQVRLDQEAKESFLALMHFIRTGQGFISSSAGKGSFSSGQAGIILSRCRQEIISGALNQDRDNPFSLLSAPERHSISRILQRAEQSLNFKVRPDLVVEWLAVNLWKTMSSGER